MKQRAATDPNSSLRLAAGMCVIVLCQRYGVDLSLEESQTVMASLQLREKTASDDYTDITNHQFSGIQKG